MLCVTEEKEKNGGWQRKGLGYCNIPFAAVGTWMAARVAAMAWSSAEDGFFSSVLPALLLSM